MYLRLQMLDDFISNNRRKKDDLMGVFLFLRHFHQQCILFELQASGRQRSALLEIPIFHNVSIFMMHKVIKLMR